MEFEIVAGEVVAALDKVFGVVGGFELKEVLVDGVRVADCAD